MVFYDDLVYGLKYSLETEVGGYISLSGDSLQALKQYINILSMVSHTFYNSGDIIWNLEV